MEKITVSIFLLMSFVLKAQFTNNYIIDYGEPNEVNLAYPNNASCLQLIPAGIDLHNGNQDNTIFYGQTPSSSKNKPVIVFLHGYSSNSETFTKGCDNMYSDVYNAGYRSAYISATPNHHMWTNGFMLNKMLDKVLTHYNVNNVVLVGWSKGGVDIDAAIAHFGARNKVSKVIALSSPFYGTWIAEFSHSWIMSIPNIFFRTNNDASRCLQRGYMNFFRSVTDNKPTVQWATMGAWGNGPISRLLIPQSALALNGGSPANGGNDGVVPYASSRRPGGTELYGGQYFVGWGPFGYYTGPSVTNLDHFEITQGKYSWATIMQNLPNSYHNRSTNYKTFSVATDYFPNSQVKGTGQILISNGKTTTFKVENAKQLDVILLSDNIEQLKNINLITPRGKRVISTPNKNRALNQDISVYQLEKPTKGNYAINVPRNTVILVNVHGGVEPVLNTGLSANKKVYTIEETPQMFVEVPNGGHSEISGTITRTGKLDASAIENVSPKPFTTVIKDGKHFVKADKFDMPGIYEIIVQIDGANFQKTIQTTFAVVGKNDLSKDDKLGTLDIQVFPNPFTDFVKIDLTISGSTSEKLEIFDFYGRLIKAIDISNLQKGNRTINYRFNPDMAAAAYIVKYSDYDKSVSKIIIKK